MIEIIAYGIPGPQGSKKGFYNKKLGRVLMVESSAKVKPWREAVKSAAIEACPKMLTGPISVNMIFVLPKPKSAPKNRQTFPDKKPDLSKLIRSTEDALTDAGIWEDDARVVLVLARKTFPGEYIEGLERPGVRILINSYEGQ